MDVCMNVQFSYTDRDNPPICVQWYPEKPSELYPIVRLQPIFFFFFVFFFFHVDMNQWPKWKLPKPCAKPIHSAQTLISLRWSLTFQLLVWQSTPFVRNYNHYLTPSTRSESRFSSSHSFKRKLLIMCVTASKNGGQCDPKQPDDEMIGINCGSGTSRPKCSQFNLTLCWYSSVSCLSCLKVLVLLKLFTFTHAVFNVSHAETLIIIIYNNNIETDFAS